MLSNSKPLDLKVSKKLKLEDKICTCKCHQKIKHQRIGKMFDDIDDEKIELTMRLKWLYQDIKGAYHDVKYVIRNYIKWYKTLSGLRPWEGFDGLISVMQTHLRDYIKTEQKYGHSTKEYENKIVASAKETVALLERMRDPMEYSSRRRSAVDAKYPKYKSLITKHNNGTSYSGDFIAQGRGWVGMESGKNPRKGYFEFINGRFELANSPDQAETDRLLAQLMQYHEEVENAYRQAEVDSEKDFERLGKLLKENLYTWWD